MAERSVDRREAPAPHRFRIGLIGARGHVGAELVRLLEGHERLELVYASSRQLAGQRLCDAMPGVASPLTIEDLGPAEAAARGADAMVLALPNDLSEPYVAAAGATLLVDLSADHRFDDRWTYGLPERNRAAIARSRAIANPGCYATAAQLALAPLLDLCAGTPTVFGVSGYSGAGTTPSPRNDPEALRDNLMPYALVGHTHEREVSRQLGRPVAFMPHVAPFFRGISLTVTVPLAHPLREEELRERFERAYQNEPLVTVQSEAPQVRDIAGQHEVRIGGFALDPSRVALVSTIDNLLKGAATQALQNLNLALGLPELMGIYSQKPKPATAG